jgi:hypothetical protein
MVRYTGPFQAKLPKALVSEVQENTGKNRGLTQQQKPAPDVFYS